MSTKHSRGFVSGGIVQRLGCMLVGAGLLVACQSPIEQEGELAQGIIHPVWRATDLVWQHPPTGEKVVWELLGGRYTAWRPILPEVLDLAWRLETTGDFDGDGDVDYAWRRYPSGEVLIWFLNEDGKYLSYGSLPSVEDTGWSIVGASDINRDGFEDLVWYHSSSRESLVWYLNGSTYLGFAAFAIPGGGWSLRGAGDLNGDQQPDLVWRHSSGANYAWFMKAGQGTSIGSSAPLPTVDGSWRLDAVDDVDLDGRADLLWRNAVTGENIIWFMDSANVSSWTEITAVGDANWRIAGTRLRPLVGEEVPARSGTAAYERGVRRWFLMADGPGAEAGLGTHVRVAAASNTAVLLHGRYRLHDDTLYTLPQDQVTYDALRKSIAPEPLTGTRGVVVISDPADVLAMYRALGQESPSLAARSAAASLVPPPGEFQPCSPRNLWLLNLVGLLPSGDTDPLGQSCLTAFSEADLKCCMGLPRNHIPAWCGRPPQAKEDCECALKLPGTHSVARKAGNGLRYSCQAGTYNYLIGYDSRGLRIDSFGGICRASESGGEGPWYKTHHRGLRAITAGSFDDTPQLKINDSESRVGFCGATSDGINFAAGKLGGKDVGTPVDYYPSDYDSYRSAHGTEYAYKSDNWVNCEGWVNYFYGTNEVDSSTSTWLSCPSPRHRLMSVSCALAASACEAW